MAPVPAHRALGYALSRDVVGIYLVLLTGLALLFAVPDLLWGFSSRLVAPIVGLSRLVGFDLFYVGLVALLYEVIADASAER